MFQFENRSRFFKPFAVCALLAFNNSRLYLEVEQDTLQSSHFKIESPGQTRKHCCKSIAIVFRNCFPRFLINLDKQENIVKQTLAL